MPTRPAVHGGPGRFADRPTERMLQRRLPTPAPSRPVPQAAKDLLADAGRGLGRAIRAEQVTDRYAAAHLAALRGAAAVLATKARPGRARRPALGNCWQSWRRNSRTGLPSSQPARRSVRPPKQASPDSSVLARQTTWFASALRFWTWSRRRCRCRAVATQASTGRCREPARSEAQTFVLCFADRIRRSRRTSNMTAISLAPAVGQS